MQDNDELTLGQNSSWHAFSGKYQTVDIFHFVSHYHLYSTYYSLLSLYMKIIIDNT